jgi:hypothetical protein
VGGQDHVFIVNRNDMTHKEAEVSEQAPPFIEFDADGKVVNSFGDWKTVLNTTHGCTIDYEGNFWTAGNGDGVIQKYSHDGRLMMQIGERGVVDNSVGTLQGRLMNSTRSSIDLPISPSIQQMEIFTWPTDTATAARCFRPGRKVLETMGAGHKRGGGCGCRWRVYESRALRSPRE